MESLQQRNIAATRRWFNDVWNDKKPDAIGALFAPHGISHGLGDGGQDLAGPEHFRAFWETIHGAFSGLHLAIEDIMAEGDRVACRWTVCGTHSGDGMGLPATGKPFEVGGMSFTRFEEGMIVESWNSWDVPGLMRQLSAE